MPVSKAELVGRVRDLARRQDVVGEFTRHLTTDADGWPVDLDKMTGPALHVVIDAAETFDRFTDAVVGLEEDGARMAMQTIEYGNGRVGVDGAGNLISVQFDNPTLAIFEVASP